MQESEQHAPGLMFLSGITYSYPAGSSEKAVLHDVSLSSPVGQSCAIVGTSDSGKSTLLSIIGLLDKPATGKELAKGRFLSQYDAHSTHAVLGAGALSDWENHGVSVSLGDRIQCATAVLGKISLLGRIYQ